MKAPIAGICFVKQGEENYIYSLSEKEAISRIIPQTIYRFNRAEKTQYMLSHVDQLIKNIPIFELINLPNTDAARLSYEVMLCTAIERGL